MKANRLEMKKKSKCEVFFFSFGGGDPFAVELFPTGYFRPMDLIA